MVQPRTLLVISLRPKATMRADIAAGLQPRRDYEALQHELGADVLYLGDAQATRLGRLISRLLGPRAALTWAAFLRRHEYDVLYTETEGTGLPLAMLLKLSRARAGHPRHVTLAHYLSPLKKRGWFRFGVGNQIDALIVHCAAQRALATGALGMPSERVLLLPYFVDERFWRPHVPADADASWRPMICSAGLEFRDYATLIEAVRDLDVEVRIAASSALARHVASGAQPRGRVRARPKAPTRLPALPPNVSLESHDYMAMRHLYAAARFVVMPVRQVDFQAGVTVILEAMAMGKAVIVSGTRGQTDVVRDRRSGGRGRIVREWWPGFLDAPGAAATLGRLPTGLYVNPGDPSELRRAIQYLLHHPEVVEELGCNGRRVAEEYFGLDAFAQRFATAIRGEQLPPEVDGRASSRRTVSIG